MIHLVDMGNYKDYGGALVSMWERAVANHGVFSGIICLYDLNVSVIFEIHIAS